MSNNRNRQPQQRPQKHKRRFNNRFWILIGLLAFAAIFLLSHYLGRDSDDSSAEAPPQTIDTNADFVQVANYRIIDPEGLITSIVYNPHNNTINLQHTLPIYEQREVDETTGFTYIRISNPRAAFDTPIVIIDAGHGGNDIGAPVPEHPEIFESHIVLEIALRLYELFERSDSGITAVMTRTTDTFVSPADRSEIGNTMGDIFISIHTNAFDDPEVSGTETLFNSIAHPDNGLLAHTMQSHLVAELGTRDRGIIFRNDLEVLNTLTIPAVFVEIDFKTNPQALANLQNGAYQQRIANALYNGIIATFNGE
ncbi:MAG: N-acetylmuramoyl-L-alanine amidase [Defluviitaleaceae bacterium]|nr:N-acetylmuramoyl-L-alanine amidase [Defluviitaleaceae bacterium]